MEDLDLLGAEGLAGQYIVLRVRSIDRQKLGRAIGGGALAAALPAALAIIDFAPGQILPLLAPAAIEEARNTYGVDLEYQIQDAPPPKGQQPKGTTKVLVGVALGLAGAFAASHFGLIGGAKSAMSHLPFRRAS